MEWSAKPHQVDEPFGSWADDLAAAFVRLEPRKIAEHPFEGTITRSDAAPIQISCVQATKHSVLRLRSHITQSKDDLCFVNLQLEGVGRYVQRGHEQTCGPGDLAVADTTEPFEIANCRDFRLFCFAVPRHLLPPGFSERPRLPLSATAAGRALSRTLGGYAELCLNASQPSGIPALSGASIVELISHAPRILAEGPSERMSTPVVLSMMLDYIDRHSEDPSSAPPCSRQGSAARRATCTGCFPLRVKRSENISTTDGLLPAPAICSIPITGRRRLRKSRSPRGSGTFRISTGCSSAAMAQPPVSFAVP
jgi:AraC family transcriptional activator of tynA and feaB